MNTTNIINLVKTVGGVLLNQKNIAFFEEASYSEGNQTLGALGIDTNTVLGGAFSDVKEILKGGKSGLDNALLDGAVSFIMKTSPANAKGSSSSQIFEHPLEYDISKNKIEGAQNYIADHSIILPQTFDCVMYLPPFFYTSVLNEVDSLNRKKTLIRIVAKGKVYPNMVLMRYDNPYTPDKLHRLPISMHFREIQLVSTNTKKNKNPSDDSGGNIPGQ